MDKFDWMKAQAHTNRLKAQTVYTQNNKDGLAAIGAPQRDHVATTLLYVALRAYRARTPGLEDLLGYTLDLLQSDGYDRDATWTRMKVMARQPRRKLTPPKPKAR